eukprot:CAMPEP_0206455568 /NCGR_PEP_ID=MMETSP0324_2-20121206/21834_1 /ASSEMBLY_ACC=CAM_ASM_000836 /TAXON_ID=2866 /ORGANISM="Crypthecodinium cohnii, Strain Seligo" /LENGTH=345 /DNA_ID=CAMNT_0053926305 /DNA_START=211 /DNA_END=1248 /DNA_ORIENTATION=+
MTSTGAVKAAVKTLHAGKEISPQDASEAMKEIMSGGATQAQIGAFLALLTLDKCGPGIIHALADVMRSEALTVELSREPGFVVDIVGTGGDGQDTFNISTAAGIIAAGAGARVVKHGNRAASSKSGAADILEALGAKLEVMPDRVPGVLEASNFCFLFARSYHPAMKYVGPARLEIGIRTVFNILGPLTNPAKPDGIVCGVYSASLGSIFAEVFKMLGMKRAMVVHGCEGLDELSIAGPSKVWELSEDGAIKEYEVSPSTFGLETRPLKEVAGGTPEENVKELGQLLAGGGRPAVLDMILMNAAAALYVAGKAKTLLEGVAVARAALPDGRATRAAAEFVKATNV